LGRFSDGLIEPLTAFEQHRLVPGRVAGSRDQLDDPDVLDVDRPLDRVPVELAANQDST